MGERLGYYYKKPDNISRARLDAILEAYSSGEKDPDNLADVARSAERLAASSLGKKTEERFANIVKSIKVVDYVRHSLVKSDQEYGIDFWISFEPESKLPELPVQVKSSNTGVAKFRKTKEYKQLDEKVIVVNCGPHARKKIVMRNLMKEIDRIKQIL